MPLWQPASDIFLYACAYFEANKYDDDDDDDDRQRRRSTALSSKCEQCDVYSSRRKLNGRGAEISRGSPDSQLNQRPASLEEVKSRCIRWTNLGLNFVLLLLFF